jgi:hypothetical protein
VTWASSVTEHATVSNATGTEGLATAVSVGATTISAALGGVTGSTVLTVTPATLQSITVTPAHPPAINVGDTLQFTATGLYSDNSMLDVTTQATWGTSDGSVALESNAAGTIGLATAVGPGTCSVTATLSGKTGSATLDVN